MASKSGRTSWRKDVRINADVEKVIVLGCPRSGTTFLSTLFDCIPEAESMMGTLLPPAIPAISRQITDRRVYDALAISFERSIDTYLHSGRFFSRAAALQKWANAPAGLPALRDAMKGRREIDLFIYKEPTMAYAPEWVLQALPHAKYILIHRDGRDVANSLVKSYNVLSDEGLKDENNSRLFKQFGRQYDERYVPWWVEEGRDQEFIESSQYVRAIWMWKYMVRQCQDVLLAPGKLAEGQLLVIYYEEMMRNATDVGRDLADFLGVKQNKKYVKRLSSAHTRSIGSYKKRPAAEVEEAERIAAPELKELGYL